MENMEKKILEAAEILFIEQGFEKTTTGQIAKIAGCNQALVHYYYRTKEQLFQKIFKEKVQIITQMFNVIVEQNTDFLQTLRLLIETQFKFIAQNQQLPMFIFKEIVSNNENREWAIKTLFPHLLPFISAIEKMLNIEISKGAVRPITIQNLMMNIISLNISTFVALPLLKETLYSDSSNEIENILNERCESNVQFILKALQP